MSQDTAPIEIVERNLVAFFRHVAQVRPSGELAEIDGVWIASAGIRFHMFNAAFFSGPVAERLTDLEGRIGGAAQRLGAQGRRWAFWACEERMARGLSRNERDVFARRGLGFAYRHPGMLAERLWEPDREPALFDIRPVVDRQSRLSFSHVNSIAFRIPFEWCLELYDIEALWGGPFEGWVGYRNGEAVATAATLVAGGATGLYAVATLPEHRRKGCAEGLVRHAVAHIEQSQGIGLTVLQATQEALPLYRRMGYQTVTHFSVFST
jgi:ribosomal protein S18 acetylase RimI-like enzyme